MDKFGVPTKINRHVLKAICSLHEDGNEHPSVSDICDAVEVTMRNNVPVRNLQAVVVQSLQNMKDCGVIGACGSSYFLHNPDASASVSGKSSNDSELNKPTESGSGSVASGSQGTLHDSSSGGDFADSPRKRQSLTEARLDRRSSGEMDFDEVAQLKVDMPASFQDTEKSSSFLPNPPKFQNVFETPLQSPVKTLMSGSDKDQTTGSEHDSKITTANLKIEDTSSPMPRDEDAKNFQINYI